ncbi:MAG TPA: hypothetical protein ENN22_05000 [bacterium]|nr:hypothetical protein [bacterium]
MDKTGGIMTINTSLKKEALNKESTPPDKQNIFNDNLKCNEKWVYFAIAKRWRKVSPDFL